MKRLVLLSLSLLTACSMAKDRASDSATQHADSVRTDSIARARQDSINRTLPGYVIDSALSPDEDLRRFRAALGGAPATAFSGGSPSREALVRRFMKAIIEKDSADLRTMVVHAREFADLYYPDSPNAHPPLYESPALAWSMIQNPSISGLTRLLKYWGGHPIRYAGHLCEPKVLHEGKTNRYTGCLVRIVDAKGDTTNRLMFGSIVERNGMYKFLSYSNRL